MAIEKIAPAAPPPNHNMILNTPLCPRVVHGSDGPAGRVGSGRVGSGRVGSGRVGSGRVGSGRVGSRFCRISAGRVGSALRIF